jgi:hypothetical protein
MAQDGNSRSRGHVNVLAIISRDEPRIFSALEDGRFFRQAEGLRAVGFQPTKQVVCRIDCLTMCDVFTGAKITWCHPR